MSNFLSGGIPIGDKLRMTASISCADFTTTTLLTVASGGGVLHYVLIGGHTNESLYLTNVKVTVDGAAERTFDATAVTLPLYFQSSNVGKVNGFVLPLPIAFATSLTLKITLNTENSGATAALAVYSIL